MPQDLSLGAPGIYIVPEEPIRALTGARMDVCAFVGVAPRGPVRPPRFEAPWADRPCDPAAARFPRSVAVPVESFDAYRRLFGGFEGPGRLPYAVASFFEQGGRRAYVARIVHMYRTPLGEPDDVANAARVATAVPHLEPMADPPASPLLTQGGDPVVLRARDEGSWGNRLQARLSFTTRPLRFESATASELDLGAGALPGGSLLRLALPGGVKALRYVSRIDANWSPERPARRRRALFDLPLAAAPESAEIVDGLLDVDDGDGRTERHTGLALSPLHPRWLAAVLYTESILLYPTAAWIDGVLDLADPLLPAYATPDFQGGADEYEKIEPADFFDDSGWTLGDDCPGAGIHALVNLPDLGSLCVPDLYSPGPLVPVEDVVGPVSLAGPEFAPCVKVVPPPEQAAPAPELDGLRLDPRLPADLEIIVGLQQQVVSLAETLGAFIVLLDLPPGLNQRQILRWRERFDSAYAAAYHPWLQVSRRDDRRDALVRVNPSAVAAGIVAQREIALGIPHGPANVIAAGVVAVDDPVSPARHDELHQGAVNVFLLERDGVRLTGARTLSRDPLWRQLSVRRLLIMLRRTLEQQMQWAVFEPNGPALQSEIRHLLENYLRRLYRANAFRGATEAEAFFVRCDGETNPPASMDQGRLLALVGVAPAEPMEFLVLQIAREGDGTLRVRG